MAAKKKKWVQAMHLKRGALHEDLGVPEGKPIPVKQLKKAASQGGTVGRRARLAETLESFH